MYTWEWPERAWEDREDKGQEYKDTQEQSRHHFGCSCLAYHPSPPLLFILPQLQSRHCKIPPAESGELLKNSVLSSSGGITQFLHSWSLWVPLPPKIARLLACPPPKGLFVQAPSRIASHPELELTCSRSRADKFLGFGQIWMPPGGFVSTSRSPYSKPRCWPMHLGKSWEIHGLQFLIHDVSGAISRIFEFRSYPIKEASLRIALCDPWSMSWWSGGRRDLPDSLMWSLFAAWQNIQSWSNVVRTAIVPSSSTTSTSISKVLLKLWLFRMRK